MLGPVWLRVVSGTKGGAAGQRSCACVGCVCLYVLQRCPEGVAHSCLGSATLPQQQSHCSVPPRRVPHQELCVSIPQVLMDLTESVWGFTTIYVSVQALEVCEMLDLMLRDNFGQLSVGPETLGEAWEVPPKKQSPVGHCRILRMDQIK